MAKRKVTVEILGDAASLKRALGDSDKEVSGWGAKMGGAGKAAAAGLAAGVAVAGVALVDAAKAAMEDQAAAAKLAQTMRQATGATDGQVRSMESFITKTSIATGVADDQLRPALANLMIAGRTQSQSQKDIAVAMDIATAKGLDLETVTNAMSKAALGNTGALGKLGVATKDAEGNALSFEQILANASKTMGGAASDAANTVEGRFQRVGVQFQEIKESVGAALLPALGNAAGFLLEKVGPAMQQVGDWIGQNLGPALKDLAGWFQEKVWPAVQQVAGILGGALKDAFQAISQKIEQNRPALESLWAAFKGFYEFLVTYIWPFLATTLGAAFKVVGFVIGQVIDQIGRTVAVFKLLWQEGQKAFEQLKAGASALAGFFSGIVSRIASVFSGVAEAIAGPFKAAFNSIARFWNNTVGKLSFKVPDWVPVVGGKSWDVPDIPLLASGGTALRGGLSWVGENGPELLDLPGGASVVPLSRAASAGGGTQVVEVRLTADEVMTALVAGLRKTVRVQGGSVQSVLGTA